MHLQTDPKPATSQSFLLDSDTLYYTADCPPGENTIAFTSTRTAGANQITPELEVLQGGVWVLMRSRTG